MNTLANPSNSQLLRSQVYEHLRKELRSRRLQPGSFVSMSEFGKELGMSRTPLRDALLQLQAEGFVTFLPQRGILINELSQQEIEDLYEVLGALDSRGLLSVFAQIGPEEVQRMKIINEQMLEAVSDISFHQYFDLNTEFHNVYLHFSRNGLLLNQINILRQRLFDFAKARYVENICMLNYQEHLQLIELIAESRAKEAADFLRDVHCSINWQQG
ncbi:MAG: GntR family transcriptional regulator [Syntrophobacteraceae bacterium]